VIERDTVIVREGDRKRLKHKIHNVIILRSESDLENVLITPSCANSTIF